MLNMADPPVHTRIRGLVSRAFAPRALARLEPWLRERAREVVAAAVARGACDLLVDVAAELPLQTIAHLLGVPQGDRHQLFRWTTTILDYQDRELDELSPALVEAGVGMRAYGARLIERKRTSPADDVLSAVVHARLEGEGATGAALSEAELQAFFSLLFTAGSETTRNSIAGGVVALLEHRAELEGLLAEPALLPTAVEEILRWTSATAYNRRTATRDVELGGQAIRAGQKTTHWVPSANRDEAVFPHPFRFDVRRSPNPHVAFGHGLHHCLGAQLARSEIRILLEELLPHLRRAELAGPIEWGRSNKHTSLRHVPLRF
jgi:cytochrome P450